MVLTQYPVGLHAKTNYFRVDETTWNRETVDYILLRMNVSEYNIKPVFLIKNDETVEMFVPNVSLNALTPRSPVGVESVWQIQCERRARWMRDRTIVQKDNTRTTRQKEIDIELINQREGF